MQIKCKLNAREVQTRIIVVQKKCNPVYKKCKLEFSEL